jgi:protein ImuA
MSSFRDSLESLKSQIARIERVQAAGAQMQAAGYVRTGHAEIDAALGGGLARGRVHEVFAAEAQDAGCATGFVAVLALRLGGTLVWLREGQAEKQGGRLHAPGLAEIGLHPAQVILGIMPDPLAVLRAAADVVRCPEVGVAVVELWREPRLLDLTASRRLALAAEASGVTVIALRIAAAPSPSAAQTRWQVAAAPSLPMEANAPGYPAWGIELLRQRGRPAGGRWRVEWNREQARLADAFSPDGAGAAAGNAAGTVAAAALSGAVLPLSAGRPADPAAPPLRYAG